MTIQHATEEPGTLTVLAEVLDRDALTALRAGLRELEPCHAVESVERQLRAVVPADRKTCADGRTSYHDYRVAVDRPAAAFNWTAFGGDTPVEADIPASLDHPQSADEDIPF